MASLVSTPRASTGKEDSGAVLAGAADGAALFFAPFPPRQAPHPRCGSFSDLRLEPAAGQSLLRVLHLLGKGSRSLLSSSRKLTIAAVSPESLPSVTVLVSPRVWGWCRPASTTLMPSMTRRCGTSAPGRMAEHPAELGRRDPKMLASDELRTWESDQRHTKSEKGNRVPIHCSFTTRKHHETEPLGIPLVSPPEVCRIPGRRETF